MSKVKAGEAYVEVTSDTTSLERGAERSRNILEKLRDFISRKREAFRVKQFFDGSGQAVLALEKIKQKTNEVNSSVKKLPLAFSALNAVVGSAYRRVASFAAEFGQTGDVYDKASARLGISARSLSEYDYAAQRCGATLGDVESAVKNIQKQLVNAQNGSDGARKAFEQLGLSVSDLAQLTPERQFEAVARAVSSIGDPTLRAGAALRLMRDAGQKLLPLFNEGPEGLRRLREEAKRLGASFSDDDAKLGAGYVDAITNLKASWQGLKNALSSAVVPSLQKAVETITSWLIQAREWSRSHQETIQKISDGAKAVAPYAAAIATLVVGFAKLKTIVPALASPWGAITAGIVAAVAALGEWRKRVDGVQNFQWSEDAQKQLDQRDAKRKELQADLERLKTLRNISKEQTLGASQIEEATRLAQKIRDAYGDVGVEVDKTTGKIKLAADAQNEFNRRVLEAQKREIEAALVEARRNASYHAASLKVAGEEDKNITAWDRFKGGYGKNGMGIMGRIGSMFSFTKEEKNLAILQGSEGFDDKVKAKVAEAAAEVKKLEEKLAKCNENLENVPNEPLAELVETEEEYQKKIE